MKKLFTLCAAMVFAIGAMADGTQSVKVTFDGTNTNWKVSSGGRITSVANGVVNVNMALQDNNKYRADLQYQTSGTYTMDKTKDVVWAIKLTGALPGTNNSRKFELRYKNSSNADTWINNINGPSGTLDCNDGGKIYYFNLGADGLDKLKDVQDGNVALDRIHFIFADAVIENTSDAHYSVDWIASFASVTDLTASKEMYDDAPNGKPILNETTSTEYNDINTALTNVAAGNTLKLRDNISVSARMNFTVAGNVTLDGQGYTIRRRGNNYILILTKDYAGSDPTTIKNVVIDGNNENCSADVIEVNKSIVLDNVTFKNHKTASGKYLVKRKGGNISLKGNMVFENINTTCFYLPQGARLYDEAEAVTGNPTIKVADDYADNYLIAANNQTEPTAFAANRYIITNIGHYLYVNSGHSTQSDKYGLTLKKVTNSYTLNVTAAGVSTLILPFDASIPNVGNFKAYTLNYTGGNNVTAKEVDALTANTAYYIVAEPRDYEFTGAANYGNTSYSTGALTGVFTTTIVPENSYILYNGKEGVGFYKSDNSTVAAFRCYLTAEGAPANLRINFGEATGISEVQSSTAKVRGAECFNLNGQRVNNSATGIVIINGKKFINK